MIKFSFPVDGVWVECKILVFLLVDILNLFQYREGGREGGREAGRQNRRKRETLIHSPQPAMQFT